MLKVLTKRPKEGLLKDLDIDLKKALSIAHKKVLPISHVLLIVCFCLSSGIWSSRAITEAKLK